MDRERYAELTRRLEAAVAADPRVVGLVALGSMARAHSDAHYRPDRFSDHDFFLVTLAGAQRSFREDLSWLPDAPSIALAFQETAHGLKVLYADGHLLEFAVFDLAELALARVNRYQVLLDRADLETRMRMLATHTAERAAAEATSDRVLFGQFLCHLVVGVGRSARGEELSGRHAVMELAQRALVTLLARRVPATQRALLDNLDPRRRFERAHPELGRELVSLATTPTLAAARSLLALAERELVPHLDFDTRAGVGAVRNALDVIATG